jgi:hypothetical protein
MNAQRDLRPLEQVLSIEECFLSSGGYDEPPADRPGGPSLIFQDSPSCPNWGCVHHPTPCSECALIQLVPAEKRGVPVPCRHIPLNDIGETIETLYRWGTLEEAKQIRRDWLKRTIGDLRFMRSHSRRSTGIKVHPPDAT